MNGEIQGAPLVSVIIPSWERKEDVLKTLEDLRLQTHRGFETIVVDQGSRDGGPEAIAARHPEVRLVRLEKNIGAPAARNLGARQAKGRVLVFIDNDASLAPDALEAVLRRFEKNGNLGIIGFKVLNASTRELDMASWTYQKNKIAEAANEFETYLFCGCGYAMKKEIFDKGASYWEELFWLAEEADLSLRVLKMGYRIIYFPDAVVYHRVSPEKRPPVPQRERQGFRNLLWITWKYYPLPQAVAATFLKSGAYLVKGLRRGYFWAIVSAIFLALPKAGLFFDKKDRLGPRAWERYRKLSQKGPWLRTVKEL